MDFQSKFETGLSYTDFLNKYGTEEQQRRFGIVYDSVELTESQKRLIESMTRKVYLLCMAGAWCGDCVEQCPILQRLCEATPSLELRFIDRDSDGELSSHLRICGAARVPQVVFLNEDFDYLGQMGDRTLAKYRRMSEQLKGAACPTGLGADAALTQEVTQQWLDEIERIHWIVRLSPKLRERHGD
jgi:thiol-disulfide isomerase/thioredoxin